MFKMKETHSRMTLHKIFIVCINTIYYVAPKSEIHELQERLKYRVFSTMINLSFDMNMNTNTNPPLVHAMALNDKRRFLSQMKYHKKVCE